MILTFLKAPNIAMHLALEPHMIPSEFCRPSFKIQAGMAPVVELCAERGHVIYTE